MTSEPLVCMWIHMSTEGGTLTGPSVYIFFKPYEQLPVWVQDCGLQHALRCKWLKEALMIRSGESLRSVLFNMSYISDRCLRKEKERNVKIQQVVF